MHALKVSIFVNEADEWQGQPLYAEVLRALAQRGSAGATILRAISGYTGRGGVNEGALPPLVIEFVDDPERVERILPTLAMMVGNRLVITSPVEIRHGGVFEDEMKAAS